MGISTVSKEIDKKLITVTTFPAREGLSVMVRLTKLLAPSLATLTAGAGKTKQKLTSALDIDLPVDTLKQALNSLVERLDEKDVLDLISLMLRYVKVDKKDIGDDFDLIFAGEYTLLFKVLWYVIEANGFFGKGDIGKALTSLTKKSPA